MQRPGKLAALAGSPSNAAGAMTMEKPTEYKDVTSYNNFYEFGTDKADPAKNAHTLKTTPWTVEVEGLVKKPAKYRWKTCSSSAPRKSASIACAASKAGRW